MNKFYILTIFILFFSINLNSSPTGYTGVLNGTSGCGSCHANQNTNITLTHSGSTTVTAGATVNWTITVYRASATKSGIDIGVKTSAGDNAGTLTTTATGLKVSSSEVTHSSTRTPTNGSYTYSFSWTAPTTPGTYYLKACGTAGTGTKNDWNYLTPVTITVNPPPGTISITKPVGGESWCAGSNQTITWNYSNINDVKIELSSDGGATFNTVITPSTPASDKSYTWTIPTSLVGGNNYKVRVSDASNANVKSITPYAFTIIPVTEITTQPSSKQVCENSPTSFIVNAKGSGLSYQWRFNGNPIDNAPNSYQYNIDKVLPEHAGLYDVIVTGSCGLAVTSNSAMLTVKKVRKILSNPESKIACRGEKVEFRVSALGTDLKFQWKKNGVNLTGKTDSILTINSALASDSGSYTCQITSACEDVYLTPQAQLTVLNIPQISKQPNSISGKVGDSVAITILANGGNLNYSWKKNGVELSPKVTTPYIIFSKLKESDAGDYSCTITNPCGNISSSIAKLTIIKESSGLSLITNVIDFDTLKINNTKDTLIKIAKNNGSNAINITNITINGDDASNFSISGINLPKSLNPNEELLIKVSSSSNKCGLKNAKLSITADGTEYSIDLSAYILFAEAKIDKNKIEFSNIEIGKTETQSLNLLNSGCIDLNMNLIIDGSNCSEFSLENNHLTINPQSNNLINITYKKENSAVPAGCKLVINNYYINEPLIIPLTISTTNVNENIISENLFYPNPASNFIFINNLINITNNQIEIYNAFGERIISSIISNEQTQKLDISSLSSGYYFIKLGNQFNKLIIIK